MRWTLRAVGLSTLGLLLLFVGTAQAYKYGDDWAFNKCPTCKKLYKHTGIDLSAKAGQELVFKQNGYVFKAKHLDSKGWKWCVIVADDLNTHTYVIWHVDKVPNFKVGENVSGKKIGVVADLGGNTHVHVGLRNAPFDLNLAMKGALPACTHKPNGLPQFPEKFGPTDGKVISLK
ncbi:MAG: peptidoglycan DD-metalloendopeptidase family protein [Planctomycetes bacterium]|nr:peptidoglycan DD-metalloendopeptidase family protein [Planctomycetota bacterium]